VSDAILEVMATLKTRATSEDVDAFLDSVADDRRRSDAHALRKLMQRVTGAPATMWGPSIVGFGSQPYTNTTGTNDWFVVGFSPRKNAMTVYGVHEGYGPVDPLLAELGPHTTSKGCLYLKQLSEIDEGVLERLVRNAWERAHPA
jgi:Domain of unknown function (DU1801)